MLWPGFPIVACDNASVARCAFRELSSTRPPCCAAVSSVGLERWSDERVAVFRGLCGEAGIRCAVFRSRKGENAAARADRLERWVSSLPLHTAVFAVNDKTSAEVRAAARKSLRHIPKQMVLLGVDDLAEVKERTDIDVDPDALPLDDKETYERLWRLHGRIFKLGYHDYANRDRVCGLMRFNSSALADGTDKEPLLTSLDDGGSNATAVLQLSVEVEDVGQLFFAILCHDTPSIEAGLTVHSHIQRSIVTVREAPIAFIELR